MAVYTEVDDDALAEFLAEFDIGDVLAFKGIAEGVENSNYLLATSKAQYILTLYEKRVDPGDLPFFLGLMEHLSAQGLTCPTPIHRRDGTALGVLAGRPAAIVSFLEGLWVRRPTPRHCHLLGAAMGRLHLAGLDFTGHRRNALGLEDWRPLFEKFRGRADAIQVGLSETIEQELEELALAWPYDLPTGVIHADLFPDNVFFRGDALSGIIDFYFACNDAFAYDLAIALNAWCFEPNYAYNLTRGQALIAGYQSVRPLQQAEAC